MKISLKQMPVMLLLQALRKSHAKTSCRDTAVILLSTERRESIVRCSTRVSNINILIKNKWYHTKGLQKRFHLNGHSLWIPSTDSKVGTTLHVSIIASGSEGLSQPLKLLPRRVVVAAVLS